MPPDGNLFAAVPENSVEEIFEKILTRDGIRIERIVSQGHTSPESGWYDQSSHEWVVVLTGSAIIQFEDNREVPLEPGDYLFIPARARHRVTRTNSELPTVWLAVFWPAGE